MILCKVIGKVTAPERLSALGDTAFVLVQKDDGSTLVAADLLGAAVGSHVMICQGQGAQTLLGCSCPIDAAVTGIVLRS